MGRILRQPYARKTGNPWLDESYVFCFRRKGHTLLEEVRKGFGLEGLQGLEERVAADSGPPPSHRPGDDAPVAAAPRRGARPRPPRLQ